MTTGRINQVAIGDSRVAAGADPRRLVFRCKGQLLPTRAASQPHSSQFAASFPGRGRRSQDSRARYSRFSLPTYVPLDRVFPMDRLPDSRRRLGRAATFMPIIKTNQLAKGNARHCVQTVHSARDPLQIDLVCKRASRRKQGEPRTYYSGD